MKKKLIIGLVIGVLTLTMALPALPVGAKDPIEIGKVPAELQPTDLKLLSHLEKVGVDKEYVKLDKDYGSRLEGKSPYSVTYKDLKSGNYYMLVSALPHSDAQGFKLDSTWYEFKGKFYSGYNLFWAIIDNNKITISAENDQPNGSKEGDQVSWSPQLFINGEEIQPRAPPVILPIDPINPNYFSNTVEWDYGNGIKRTVRIIEGRIREWWIFPQNPNGEVKIKHNISGTLPLKLGKGNDSARGAIQVQVDGDSEIISSDEFNRKDIVYPLEIGASPETFYPDANPETSSVDGYVQRYVAAGEDWADIRVGAGTHAGADNAVSQLIQICARTSNDDKWTDILRFIALFDTSGLPDGAVISDATLSIYGYGKADDNSLAFNVNVYSSNPASNDALVPADYGTLGSTPFATAIAYADFSVVGYNDFALNSSGIANISKIGVSKFGFRDAVYDVSGTPPTWSEMAWNEEYIEIYSADQGDTTKDPKLVVTYIVSPPPTVTTEACTGFALLWAIVNGNIVSEETSPVTQVGFEYGLTTAYGANWTSTGEWTTGDDFWARLFPLTPATVYHYRAMAYNGKWGYGSDRVFSTEGSPTLYEYLNTGGDGDSGAIYSANWTAQQFTSANISHTVTSIRVPLKRVETYPGIVELALTYADSDNFSTGADLTSALLNGDAMSDTAYVWYDFDVPDITLAYDTSYAVVVRATSGNATDYILWEKDTEGGALADAVGSHSMDSGISWVSDSPTDYLFEIWGEVVMSVEDAQVFTGYIEEGDWLVVCTYKNTFEPYYPTDDVETYFDIQLLDDTTIKAQVNCPMWGYRPASIYISEAYADTLDWGNADYKVRLIGSFGTNPSADYSLTEFDWTGGELTFLDKWIIAQANDIGEEDEVVMTIDIADKGEVLNATGHTIFSLGIPGINEVRPDLFEMVVLTPSREEEEYTHAMTGTTDWEVKLGPTLSGVLTTWGAMMAMDGQTFGGVLTFVGFVAVFIALAAMGAWAAGLVFGYVILLGGAWVGLINWVLLGVITFVAFLIFVWQRVLSK